MDGRTDIDLAELTKRLTERRDELLRLATAGTAEHGPIELDQSRIGRLSRMDAMQQQEMAREIGRRRTLEVSRADAALKRIADDEYGYCLSCGEPIAAKRLNLDPTAPICIECAQQRERK